MGKSGEIQHWEKVPATNPASRNFYRCHGADNWKKQISFFYYLFLKVAVFNLSVKESIKISCRTIQKESHSQMTLLDHPFPMPNFVILSLNPLSVCLSFCRSVALSLSVSLSLSLSLSLSPHIETSQLICSANELMKD